MQNLELAVGQRAELNVSMEIGAASQSVTVGESVAAVETASSDVSNLRTRQQVVDLPLNGRDFTQLVQFAPGVNSHGNSTNVSNGGYFGDYEGKRVNQAQTYISTVPTAAFRTGDFSALLPRTVLHVPGTTTPLPNNQLQQIDPTAAKLITLYPVPNVPGAGLVNNFLYNGALINNIDQDDLRVDYRSTN
jgi:hypothetical protein